MTFVTWKDSLLTGIEAIDHDHMTLFDLVEQFHEAYMTGEGPKAMGPVFEHLMAYTDYHFRREEDLFDAKGFPGRESHQDSHETLKAEVQALYERFLKGELQGEETDLALELLAFMKNWLHFHIMEEDMAFRDFLAAKKGE